MMHLNIILPFTPGSSKWSVSLSFPHQNPVCTSLLPIHATCPTHLIHLHLIVRTIFGEEYKPLNGSGSVVGIATGYGLDGLGIESRWGRDFPHLSRTALGPTQPPVQ